MEDMQKNMDFGLICSLIQELLIVNERVLLPGIGEFVIESIPASFKEDGMSILPPSKKFSFNQGDFGGECEQWQVDLSGIIKEELLRNGEFEVPGFGVFKGNGAGEILFAVDEEFDFAPDSFSLEAITLEANEPETEVQREPEVVEQTSQQELERPEESEPVHEPQPVRKSHDVPQSVEQKRKKQKWVLWISVIVILLLVLVLFIVLFKEDFMELVKRILYSKEDLEIMQKWAAQ